MYRRTEIRYLLTSLLILQISVCFGQNFKFLYTSVGLGSNLDRPPHLVVTISDSILSYFTYEKTKYKIGKKYKDTIWDEEQVVYRTEFRTSSRDSIIAHLEHLKGKYIFNTNPRIMSGAIYQFYIAATEWCVEFSLKNTTDSITVLISDIVNFYLPADHKIPDFKKDNKSQKYKPLIKDCPAKSKTYFEILVEEGELIQSNKN